MGNKVKFPDVTVFYDETDYWLVDGFHRVAAAKQKGQAQIGLVNLRITKCELMQ